ncbi:hypothetical protein ACTXT7_000240 [Hymenolepis weldensis]
MIRPSKGLGQCNHVRARPMSVYRPKCSTLVDNKCKQSWEIGLAKPSYLQEPITRRRLMLVSKSGSANAKNPCCRYITLTSEPKTDPMEI